jgi:hypothetical protein
MPLDTTPPRATRFGSPLVLSRVHWVRPELVVEVTYLTWTDDRLLRQVVYEGYEGLREDKPARDIARPLAATETRRGEEHRRCSRQPRGCPSLAGPAVKLITAPVVMFGEIDNFPADARRTGQARQSAQPAGQFPVIDSLQFCARYVLASAISSRLPSPPTARVVSTW